MSVETLLLFMYREISGHCREVLKEDAAGSLQASVDDVIHKSKRRRLLDRPVNVRLGMVCMTSHCERITASET